MKPVQPGKENTFTILSCIPFLKFPCFTSCRKSYQQPPFCNLDYFRPNFTSCSFHNNKIDKNSTFLSVANLHNNTCIGQNQ